ncbi:hypothetical protein PT974_00041 [Cladobotryum mycophilum]|uniref:Uncharacterized protein n=1 Tax=Cladobotryum mycophilum TaxID=491253 RepID=A0ABR0T107_9HYPO
MLTKVLVAATLGQDKLHKGTNTPAVRGPAIGFFRLDLLYEVLFLNL